LGGNGVSNFYKVEILDFLLLMIDAHFHFSVGSDILESQWSNDRVLNSFQALLPQVEKHGVDTIYGIFAPFSKGLPELVKSVFPSVKTGLYLMLYDEPKEKLNEACYDFDFIKFHYHLCDPMGVLEMFSKKVDECIKLGYTKFQLHTSALREDQLKLLNKYTESGVKFYLAHGASALNFSVNCFRQNPAVLSGLINKDILLGTSEFDFTVMSPLEYVTNAISLGLEDNLCFETDFSFNLGLNWYSVYFNAMSETIKPNKKIYEENAKRFFA
jgi:hypothetical protein